MNSRCVSSQKIMNFRRSLVAENIKADFTEFISSAAFSGPQATSEINVSGKALNSFVNLGWKNKIKAINTKKSIISRFLFIAVDN